MSVLKKQCSHIVISVLLIVDEICSVAVTLSKQFAKSWTTSCLMWLWNRLSVVLAILGGED